MKIGLIDVDGHNYPNIPLMKISAYHKANGDSVEWYQPLFSGHMDIVYMSKVFSFTPDYEYFIDSDKIMKGGTGYAISVVDGKEIYDKTKDMPLPNEIEHIFPDYTIYPKYSNIAYGFLSRGCPRKCDFCHVRLKEGHYSQKVADLSEFWNGQKRIVLCDPNILACKQWEELLQQLIDCKAKIDFNQGMDIRMMTEKKAKMLSKIKVDSIHFAWDRYEDKYIIQSKFLDFRKISKVNFRKLIVYVLCGYKEQKVTDEDIYRITWLRENGFSPYVMIYNKSNIPKDHELRRLQRWVNNKTIFWSCPNFKEYKK